MHTSLENITYISRKYYKKIHKITSHLKIQFGITYFARQTVSKEGHWEIVGNCPDWLDHSADKGFYHIDPSLIHPDYYQSGITVNSSHTTPEFLKEMTNECLTQFDFDHTLCILNKTATGSEWYFFATCGKNNNIMSTYITQIKSFYNYIKYFNYEAVSLLQQNLDFRINLADLKKQAFSSNINTVELAPLIFDDIDDIHLNNYQITAREKDCLIYLIRGKTIKETAKLLGISPRTVEEYLIRLRQKTGCKYKRELIELFQNLS